MSFFKNILGKSDEPITSYADFWDWFKNNEKVFSRIVRERGDIEHDFFDKVTPKLNQIVDGLFLLTGIGETLELVFTPDGNIKKIVFAEELVASAPHIDGWKFLALKPDAGNSGFYLTMGGNKFSLESLHFYSKESWEQPDEIAITVTHDGLNDENHAAITHGIYIFLDNFLGELAFATIIDDLNVIDQKFLPNDLIAVQDLKKYLSDRQGKFVEKYDGARFNTEEDSFSMMEAELENGLPLIALVNSTLLTWDRKPSHPWGAGITFEYPATDNGLPDESTYQLLSDIEDEILNDLKDYEGYLNIGRETANNIRTVYFACKDFRKPSKVFDRIQKKYSGQFGIDFDIYKDKYWKSFDRFIPVEDDGPVS